MTDLTAAYNALQKADAAGDTAGAKQLADYIRSQQSTDAAPVDAAPTQTQPQRGFVEEAGRQAMLGGRALVQGAADILSTPTDALFGLANFIQEKRGQPAPFKLARDSIRDAMTSAGVPVPETPNERIASDVEGALVPAGGMLKGGQALVRGGMSAAQSLVERPAVQAASLVGGTGASSLTREQGGSEGQQISADVIGGAITGNTRSFAGGIGRGAKALLTPAFEGGRRAIAGRALNTAASDAGKASARLAQAAELVPGSRPTTGQAAGDTGLAYFENRMAALDTSRFRGRLSQQNAARQTLLDTIADGGQPERIAARVARRDEVTTGLRDLAMRQAQGKPVNTKAILGEVDALLANPDNAGESVQRALTAVRGQIEGKTDARALYAVRKEINRVLEGRYVNADESVLRYAGGQLASVKGSIDNAITEVAPAWRGYLTKYAQLSRPIERAETMQGVRQKTSLAAPDIETGRDFLSQAKWRQVVSKNLPELSQTMTRGQLTKLQRIAADLDRGAAAAAVNPRGSDTAANLVTSGQISIAHILSKTLNTPVEKLPSGLASVMRPLSFLYKLPDEDIRQLIVDAMLDPKLAEDLMREGTVENVRRFAETLAEHTKSTAFGVAAGAGAAGPSIIVPD